MQLQKDFDPIKDSLISESIFALVPFSKKCAKSLSILKLRIEILDICFEDRIKVRISSEINSPLI